MALYVHGRRRIAPPLRFGAGVLAHLLRHGRDYDVVHTASFPYFSLLPRPGCGRSRAYELVCDWHEVCRRSTGASISAGRLGRDRGAAPLRPGTQRAFCFSELHAQRLREEACAGR